MDKQAGMRIAQICHRYVPSIGGIEFYVQRLIKDSLKRGVEMEVLTTDLGTPLAGRRKEAHYFKTLFSFMGNPFSFGLLRHLQSNSYDLLHVHNIWFVPGLLAVFFRKNAKVVTTLHGVYPVRASFWRTFFLNLYKPLARYVLAKSHKIIVADSSTDRLTKMFKINPEKIVVIPNGIELSPYRPAKKDPVVLFTGRILPDKNPEILIKAAEILTRTIADFRLVFLGPMKENYRKKLVRLVKERGLEGQTAFAGTLNPCYPREKEKLMSIYKKAYVYVLLSYWEGLPTRLLEAMQFEVPCIAYASGGIPQLIRDHDNGLILDRLDEHLLAERLLVLFQSRALAKRLGQRARLTVKNHYHWPKLSKKILAVYDTLGRR